MLLLTLTALFWAGNIVLARGVAPHVPPVGLAFWRWVAALAMVLPFAARRLRGDWPAARGAWRLLALLALLGISGFNTLMYRAVHTTTAVNGALVQAAMPVAILLLSRLLFGEPISRAKTGGVLLCLGGAALVVLRGDPRNLLGLSLVQGDALMVAAVLCYALYSSLLRLRPAIHPLSFLCLTFAGGALGLLPLYLLETLGGAPMPLSPTVVLSVLYVALFPSVLAYLFWNRGVELVGASRAGLFINLIPVFAALLSALLLGEPPRAYHGIGLLLIAGGMLLAQR
jgi:drug/metabolite transporter (DMT)-like permease